MEPKNVMLLGFINKAVEYLNEHLDEDLSSAASQLKDIDLDSLKRKLSEEVEEESGNASLDKLMDAGTQAFDRFLNRKEEKEDLSDQFAGLFDIDFDEDEKKEKQELDTLLSFYDLHGILNKEENVSEEDEDLFGEDLPEEDLSDLQEGEEFPDDEEPFTEETPVPSQEAASQEEPETPYELSEEETLLLELIARNVNKKEEKKSGDSLSGANKDLDSIFSELVAAEDPSSQELPAENEDKKEDASAINQIQELVYDQIPEEERKKIIENPLVDMKIEGEEKEEEKEEESPVEEETEPVYPEQVDKDDIIKLMKDIQPLSDVYYNKIEAFIDQQEKKEAEAKKAAEEKAKSEPETEADKKEDASYVSSLIDDLKTRMNEEEIRQQEKEKAFREVYEKIHKAYPYLPGGFVRNVYELKDSINREYESGKKIIILHRTSFRNVENLRQYVEITLNHGYAINADEKKMIVDAFKQYINSDGLVITSIFEVANQSALLSGEYEGYNVLSEDDM